MQSSTNEYLVALAQELSRLYGFARQMNQLDFAGSLFSEFRGMQDAGWATTITAHQVHNEIEEYMSRSVPYTEAELRIVLMLYCQLAEAGGVYETLKNIMGVVTRQPYSLWPFKDLVRVRKADRRIIAPNANATFKELATSAKNIGMVKLSDLLAIAFNDEIRNGISHADYVIWRDGLRLRKRNGGYANKLGYDEVEANVNRGVGFFSLLRAFNITAINSFNPAKEIVGKFSANFPMKHTVFANPEDGSFSISSSAVGPETTPEYLRQIEITARLGDKVLAAFPRVGSDSDETVIKEIEAQGYEPHVVPLDQEARDKLLGEIGGLAMIDERAPAHEAEGLLLASPFGFRTIADISHLDGVFPEPMVEVNFDNGKGDEPKRRFRRRQCRRPV